MDAAQVEWEMSWFKELAHAVNNGFIAATRVRREIVSFPLLPPYSFMPSMPTCFGKRLGTNQCVGDSREPASPLVQAFKYFDHALVVVLGAWTAKSE